MKKTRKPGGGRKKLKPEYDAGKNLKEQMESAVALHDSKMSLQAIGEELGLNPIKVRKLLITADVYESEVAEKVQATEIHIAGEIDMKKLAWLSVEDYAATQMELMVVSAMKGYLRRMPEQEALKKVEDVLDPKVIQLVGDDGAPMPVQSNVDGAKLAAFIDAAVADSIRELEKREDDLSKAGVTMLENVDGKSIVEQMSPQFLEFVLDAYRGLKYTR